jgi:hypothetical protein
MLLVAICSGCSSLSNSALSISATSLNFGNVTEGRPTAQMVTLTNASENNITISNISSSGTGFSVSGETPSTIPPYGSVSIYVNFTPEASGAATGVVSIYSNASNPVLQVQLAGNGIQHSVNLSWAPSTSPVIGYFVYRGTVSGGPYDKLNSSPDGLLNYTDSDVQSGSRYFYVVKSVDSSNFESVYSGEVSAFIP